MVYKIVVLQNWNIGVYYLLHSSTFLTSVPILFLSCTQLKIKTKYIMPSNLEHSHQLIQNSISSQIWNMPTEPQKSPILGSIIEPKFHLATEYYSLGKLLFYSFVYFQLLSLFFSLSLSLSLTNGWELKLWAFCLKSLFAAQRKFY